MHLENKNTHDRGESCHTQGEAVVDAWDEILLTYRRKYPQHTGENTDNMQAAQKNNIRLLVIKGTN